MPIPPIDRSLPQPKALDWDALVVEGRTLLQKLAGDGWTDYNDHDPGVTLLEALAYALTDVAYRADSGMADLLTGRDGEIDLDGACFFTAPQIFPSAPVTLADLRKVLLDQLPGLVNVWIEPTPDPRLAGRYRVWLVPFADPPPAELITAVYGCLNQYRQLGDVFDLEEIRFVPVQRFTLKFSVIAETGVSTDQILQNIRASLARTLNPPVTFRPHQGPTIDGHEAAELFTGPLLSRGFLRDSDLWEPHTFAELDGLVADALLTAPGVEQLVSLDSPTLVGTSLEAPVIYQWDPASSDNVVDVRPTMGGASVTRPSAVVPAVSGFPSEGLLQAWANDVPRGRFLDIGPHDAIQDTLPATYGLERNGVPATAPAIRVAQIRQLRAYLFIFEQLVANACEQLARVPQLLSHREEAPTLGWQPLYELEGADAILQGTPESGSTTGWEAYQQNHANSYSAGMQALVADWNDAYGQTERRLDHLLARFGESWPRLDWQNFETTAQKCAMLAQYPQLSAQRHLGFDVARAGRRRHPNAASGTPATEGNTERARRSLPDVTNTSFLERKVNLLLRAGDREPLQRYAELPIAGDTGEEGFQPYLGRAYFLIEHQLFLGAQSGGTTAGEAPSGGLSVPRDFFSLCLTHVLTNWTYYEPRVGFLTYVEHLIRESAPAHLRQRFCWLEADEMDVFAQLIAQWHADGLPVLKVLASDEQTLTVESTGPAGALVQWLLKASESNNPQGERK
jgi:hypothetical protein